ncbi:MAG: transglutaminase-like domain-containing protein [Bacteroidales bacterium]|nr:transglutaminase-like domain-containing protein [Bacteroidales bacterium]
MTKNTKDKELNALIRLLDDPDENIYGQIREKIYTYGPEAIPRLEHAWENSFDNLIQERIENLIREIQFEGILSQMQNWRKNNSEDLLNGFLLMTRYQYPDVDTDKLSRQVAQVIQDVWLELNNELTALEKIKVINHIVFDIHKFSGNKSNFYAPDNFYLKNLLESKKGNPISLGMLYIIIAQSLKIPIYGVDLPKHFILAYSDEITEGRETVSNDDVLFYINPFNYGAVFTQNEIDLYIKQLGIKKKDKYYKPCDNIRIMRRMVTELIFSYQKSGNTDKADELKMILKILS